MSFRNRILSYVIVLSALPLVLLIIKTAGLEKDWMGFDTFWPEYLMWAAVAAGLFVVYEVIQKIRKKK